MNMSVRFPNGTSLMSCKCRIVIPVWLPPTYNYLQSQPPPHLLPPALYCISATSSVTVVNGTCNHRLWRIRICGRCKVIGSTFLPRDFFLSPTQEPHPFANLQRRFLIHSTLFRSLIMNLLSHGVKLGRRFLFKRMSRNPTKDSVSFFSDWTIPSLCPCGMYQIW